MAVASRAERRGHSEGGPGRATHAPRTLRKCVTVFISLPTRGAEILVLRAKARGAPSRYAIAQVVTRFKSLSARTVFRELPRIKRWLWGGELWEDGYFVRTVGDKVPAEIIRRYIQYHQSEKSEAQQLSLFD